jgi:hypothetical protein
MEVLEEEKWERGGSGGVAGDMELENGAGASPGGGGSGGGALGGGEACGGAGLEEELQPWEAPSLPRFLFLYSPSYII